MPEPTYIWIPNWDGPEGFQHYKGRDPIWIKNYTRLLSHDAYTDLTFTQRGILHGIWLEYASSARRLRGDTTTLTRRLGQRVNSRDINALNHAGFLELIASSVLAERLQDASDPLALTRARALARSEVEKRRSTSNRSEGPPAGDNGHTDRLPVELARLITQTEAAGHSITAIKNAARGLPEAAIAKAHESLTTRNPKPDNPIGYAIAALQHERAELKQIREQARASLHAPAPAPANPWPGEPDTG